VTAGLTGTDQDRYLEWDGAYVLGALSPSERREYEQHLAGCALCQRAVSELAGLPGLLASLGPEDAARLVAPEPAGGPPATLGATTLARARTRRRRTITWIASVAAALALVAGALGVLIARGVIPTGPQTPYRVAFSPVQPSTVTAVVDVTPGRDATLLAVECQYAMVGPGWQDQYAIWVTDRSGQATELKTWVAKPNKVMRPQVTAPEPTRRLDAVEIRSVASGATLLRAPLH
jgi:4-amino-4-deoxy-L-arabinose transferase-like glycosyltransferase